MMRVKFGQYWRWGITLAIMLLIFLFSAQSKSDSASLSLNVRGLFATVLDFIGLGKWAESELLHHFVRKCAHAFLYFSLGASAAVSARSCAWKRYGLWALLICFLYAVSDEVHQAFVPGRGPLASDVLLDTVSAAVGIVLCWLLKEKKIKFFAGNCR